MWYNGAMCALRGIDLAQWRRDNRALVEEIERRRWQELRDMTDERALAIRRSLEWPGTMWREREDWSGLVEQQAIFMRARKTHRSGPQKS